MTMIEPIYSLALLTGLLGSGHCLGMCGGLISALSLSEPRARHPLLCQLLYHGGRVTTYTLVGAMAGWLGSVLAYANLFHGVMRLALIASDLLIIVVGLGTAGLFRRVNLARLDWPGPAKAISRAAIALIRSPNPQPGAPPAPSAKPRDPLAALPLGLLMGFLPCGVSYAMAITAAQTSSLAKGGLTMLWFGVGTTPALFLFGCTINWLGNRARGWMLRTAGLLVATMGVYHLQRHISLLGWDLSGPLSFFCH